MPFDRAACTERASQYRQCVVGAIVARATSKHVRDMYLSEEESCQCNLWLVTIRARTLTKCIGWWNLKLSMLSCCNVGSAVDQTGRGFYVTLSNEGRTALPQQVTARHGGREGVPAAPLHNDAASQRLQQWVRLHGHEISIACTTQRPRRPPRRAQTAWMV